MDEVINSLIVIKDTENGKGIFAVANIPANIFLMKVHGKQLTFSETLEMKEKESYCLQIDLEKYINPNFPFFLYNHSCNPNCALNKSLEFFTIRRIAAGEELRWDYSTSMLEHYWTMHCHCGEKNCRGIIGDFPTLPKATREKYLEMEIVLPYIIKYMKK